MEKSKILELIFSGLSAVGALMAGIVAIYSIPKIINKYVNKMETYFGKQAEDIAKYIEQNNPGFTEEEYKGGKKNTPQLVLKSVEHNLRSTLPPVYIDSERIAYFYYKNNENKTMVKYIYIKK